MRKKMTIKHKISLEAVQDATPAEAEDERHVIRAMELSDPTGSSKDTFDQATGMLPPDFTDEPETVEDGLLTCTTSINQLYLAGSGASSIDAAPPPAAIFRDKQNMAATTQTDAFAANAGKLFYRFNKKYQSKRPLSVSDLETGSKKSPRNTRKHGAFLTRESMENFRNLLDSNKDYTLYYIKTTLFGLIIPATGIACL